MFMIEVPKWEPKATHKVVSRAQSMQEWLRQWKFDLFVHVTFPRGLVEARAVKWFKGFWKSLNGPDLQIFDGSVVLWIFAEKNHGDPRNVHLHVFVERVDPKHAVFIEKMLRVKLAWDFGGPGECLYQEARVGKKIRLNDSLRWISKIDQTEVKVEPYNPLEGGVFYCCKKYTNNFWAEFERFVVESRYRGSHPKCVNLETLVENTL